MKKLMIIVFLPMALFALERVNLVKNCGFEKDTIWQAYAHGRDGGADTATASSYSTDKPHSGLFSAFCDTRKTSACFGDSGVVIQGLQNKYVSDVESLYVSLAVMPRGDGYEDSLAFEAYIGLHTDAGKPGFRIPGYQLRAADIPPGTFYVPWLRLAERSFYPDTLWHTMSYPIQKDLLSKDVPMEASVDSVLFIGFGFNMPPWRGQKIYWDDIRLTGYADYDVGVKGILSGDSVWKNTGYTPTARIKNFGRKAADSFLVIAEIKNAETTVYSDTLPYALPADTEDTVSFKEFTPPDASNYTLTIHTIMDPDESDEDDEMSKTLYGTGVVETPSPSDLQLEIVSFSSVRYTLPSGERSTLTVYDPSGRRIESYKVQGEGQVTMKASLSSGVYFVKLESGKASVTKKAVVLR